MKGWGRPRKDRANSSIVHENVAESAAQPTRTGRNERSIHSSIGSIGGRSGTVRSRGGKGEIESLKLM